MNLLQPVRVDIDSDDYTNEYDNMLDEVYGEFMDMQASYILKECDPIAYRCGLNDYAENLDIEIWECPLCEEHHNDEDDATYCCQTDDEDEEDEWEDE